MNLASRMESHGESGAIQITRSTYDLIRDEFDCEWQGDHEGEGRRRYGGVARTQTESRLAARQISRLTSTPTAVRHSGVPPRLVEWPNSGLEADIVRILMTPLGRECRDF